MTKTDSHGAVVIVPEFDVELDGTAPFEVGEALIVPNCVNPAGITGPLDDVVIVPEPDTLGDVTPFIVPGKMPTTPPLFASSCLTFAVKVSPPTVMMSLTGRPHRVAISG